MEKFYRNCPECGLSIEYSSLRNKNRADKGGKICSSCRKKPFLPPFVRRCPVCDNELEYANVKNRNRAEKKNQSCASCSAKKVGRNIELKKKRIKSRRSYSGDQNPFFGKKHTQKTKNKLKKIDRSYTQTKEFRKKSARKGDKNGMYGRAFFDVWVEKYGEKEAKRKYHEWLKVQSKNSSGKNNPMYGKPAPRGSGGGWGGWYKGWYFRSLRELSYMVRVIEKNGHTWECAESKNFFISYVSHDGTPRTYRPDFFIDGKVLVEVKPKELMETTSNKLKKAAAINFCEENGFEFKMVDVKLLKTESIIKLFESGQVKFNKKYQEKVKLLCAKAKRKK